MNFLVPHDGSEHAFRALEEAVKLSQKLGGETNIEVLIVVPDLCLVDVGIDECNIITNTLYKEAQGIKAKINEKLASLGTKAEVRIEAGSEVDSILKCADGCQADFIVIGAAGKHGSGRGRLGSVADKVVSKSDRSVMIIR
ncbi:universal stress protein [Desulfurivibrio alkaliphilus]|uniref:UspA domain protein n=1 Tax=Desulfurivibrio alkaliphilus (strain DSM 19089 / UNIQEM U267 / AHT2) TaxID=589865 RepID=D6Z6M2_DESAT|nr:universal stress protein [Desulfurivibrio alkaliphilus]ADH84981.1 UspA domain protein [Desulfurivibrio alkaliphilus AHT 2]